MLVGQQLGPFTIDKELGSGAMGTVYRGRFSKTGQTVAIKVMAPGLGTTSASAADRFEREAEILKQLKHPNIVRLFGHSKGPGPRYFAMEYIQGESLDRVMARRGRMSWQEVVALGRQLCAALQHAHEKGIIHRDLKPSNLMILPDGTLKLTDFGIAKDLDETALTSTNCTVGTAAYMSPEQCKGERTIGHKSDLYSLGIVLYELVTGRKPFQADNAMEMFMLHVQGSFERPARLVADVPVWLDNLICQLMEKKAEQRPFDATMVGDALAAVQEKVEAQDSAGVEAVRARIIDRPRGDRNPSDDDKEAARLLLSRKPRLKKKRARKERSLLWLQAGGLVLLLGVVVGLLFLILRHPSPEKLYKQAERLWNSGKEENRDRAREGPIKEYLSRYGQLDDERTRQVRRWAEDYDVAGKEKLLARHLKRERTGLGLKVEAQTSADEKALKAASAEDDGDLKRALALWQELTRQEGRTGWGLVGERHAALITAIPVKEKQLLGLFKDPILRFSREPALQGPEKEAFTALRYERFGDRVLARQRFEALAESAEKDPEQRFWQLFAAIKARQLKRQLEKEPQSKEDRKKLVEKVVAEVEEKVRDQSIPRWALLAVCMDVVALYGKDPELKEPADKARALLGPLARGAGRAVPSYDKAP
jgi:serine/threonine-protein kinase